MSTCGVIQTDARLAYAQAFCAYRLLRGNIQRAHVAEIMYVILQDHRTQSVVYSPGGSPLEVAMKVVQEDLRGHVVAGMKE